MAKIVVLGKTGMLGCAVYEFLKNNNCDVFGTTRTELDAQNCTVEDIEKVIENCKYIINCIGIIKPYIHDHNSYEVSRAIEVNGLFPHKLLKAAKKNDSKIIQIATDCVYDGVSGYYDELCKHNATDVYGKSKSLGEIFDDNFMNLRCSIIGREKKSYLSLLEWFLNQPENAKINGFNNHLWNGITTEVFAQICYGIIKNEFWFGGVQHIIPQNVMTKYQMLECFKEVFKREDIIIDCINAEYAVNRVLLTNNSSRNKYIWELAGYKTIPAIEDMIKAIIQ